MAGKLSNGVATEVAGSLNARNYNSAGNLLAGRAGGAGRGGRRGWASTGDGGDVTDGVMAFNTTVTTRDEAKGAGHATTWTRHSVHRYPYRIVDNSKEDGKVTHTFLLNATVNISRLRAEVFGVSASSARPSAVSPARPSTGTAAGTKATVMEWELGVNSRGEYNRSETNHTQINLEANDSNERYALTVSHGAEQGSAGREPCFSRSLVASGGHVQSRVAHEAPCRGLPVRVCGSDVCGFGFF